MKNNYHPIDMNEHEVCECNFCINEGKDRNQFKNLNTELCELLHRFKIDNEEKLHTAEKYYPSRELIVIRKTLKELDVIFNSLYK